MKLQQLHERESAQAIPFQLLMVCVCGPQAKGFSVAALIYALLDLAAVSAVVTNTLSFSYVQSFTHRHAHRRTISDNSLIRSLLSRGGQVERCGVGLGLRVSHHRQ